MTLTRSHWMRAPCVTVSCFTEKRKRWVWAGRSSPKWGAWPWEWVRVWPATSTPEHTLVATLCKDAGYFFLWFHWFGGKCGTMWLVSPHYYFIQEVASCALDVKRPALSCMNFLIQDKHIIWDPVSALEIQVIRFTLGRCYKDQMQKCEIYGYFHFISSSWYCHVWLGRSCAGQW